MSELNLRSFYETLQLLYLESIELLKSARKIRDVFDAAPHITLSMDVNETIKAIVEFICESLGCERATVFAMDKKTNVLWSKVAIGTSVTITVPVGKGIAGFVASTANSLNIRDAYLDSRFDSSIDMTLGYKTKSVIAVPIIGISGEVEGVVQAINKLPDRHGHQRSFDRNDLGIVEMIANLASSTFHNSLEFNQQSSSMNNLKIVLKTGSRLIKVRQ